MIISDNAELIPSVLIPPELLLIVMFLIRISVYIRFIVAAALALFLSKTLS